ncbi:hypothetical protein DEA8626_02717 [Defluviimonas aquaemixtae]|uniref:Uncharacterized protein n=1 Tax=Albidovulum aquaemixtae TaxID=1542388 RepID=A0A2R8BJR9_9RHOB|nr:hypothetical protein [Defluviimonas aquaemixtae]SPH23651.1 hypothetical protein DEA8626_02717 [Defluviimonas aquaemixtae]
MTKTISSIIIFTLTIATLPSAAMAYIGPGVGAGAIAAVIGVLGSVFLAIVAVLYYPIKRMMKGRKARAEKSSQPGKPAE